MKRYTVTFLFNPELDGVWLITKQKPDWQKGCLNGIGGKIEDGESPLECAVRELMEEAGTEVNKDHLFDVGEMIGVNNDGGRFQVYIFAGVTLDFLETQEEEQIGFYSIDEVKNHPHIENVPMLIEACIYRMAGQHSSFNRMIMHYDRVQLPTP